MFAVALSTEFAAVDFDIRGCCLNKVLSFSTGGLRDSAATHILRAHTN